MGQGRAELGPEQLDAITTKARGALVRVEAVDEGGRLFGSGFFVDKEGTIITAYSVGGESNQFEIVAGSLRLPAERILADARSGIALLRINSGTPALELAEEVDTNGRDVVVLGFPMGGDLTSQAGTISGREFAVGGRILAASHLKALVPPQPGLGGAPLVDSEGRVVGIVVSRAESSLGCLALPSTAIKKLLNDHSKYGEVRHGWLGIELEDIDPAQVHATARIRSVDPDGPAAPAGIIAGDIIARVGGREVTNIHDILDIAYFLTSGEAVEVGVLRNNIEKNLKLTPSAHRGDVQRSE